MAEIIVLRHGVRVTGQGPQPALMIIRGRDSERANRAIEHLVNEPWQWIAERWTRVKEVVTNAGGSVKTTTVLQSQLERSVRNDGKS